VWNFSNMSRYTMLVAVRLERKGPNTSCLDKAQDTFNFGLYVERWITYKDFCSTRVSGYVD
jgi:hypothetical protein